MNSKLVFIIFLSTLTNLIGQSPSPGYGDDQLHRDTLLARSILEQNDTLVANGAYQAALQNLENVQFLYQKHQLWERVIETAIQLSIVSDYFNSPGFKVKYTQDALVLAQQHLPKHHLLQASVFRQKSEALSMLGRMDSANYFIGKAIPIFKTHEEWTELAWCEIILGVNYLNQYELDSSMVYFQHAEGLIQEALIPQEDKAIIQASLFNQLGVLHARRGDYNKGIEYTRQALVLELDKPFFTPVDSFYIYNNYNNLGAFYFNKGDYDRALDNYTQASSSYQYALNDFMMLNNIGASLIRKKEYPSAIRYLQRSLPFAQNEDQQIMAINHLGVAYRELNNLDSALYYSQQAISLRTTSQKSASWALMGDIFIRKREATPALANMKTALEAHQKDTTSFEGGDLFISRLYQLMGDAYVLNQKPETALKFYQKALVANHATFRDSLDNRSNPDLFGIYEPIYFLDAVHAKAKTLASFTQNQQKQEQALATYQLSIQWIDTLQASYASEASQLDWSSVFKPIYEEAIQITHRLYQTTQSPKYLALAFTFSEKSKTAILLETLKSNEGKSLADVPDSLLQKEKDLHRDIAFHERAFRKASEQNDQEKIKLYQQYLSKNRLALASLKEQLEQDFPKFQAWKYGGTTTTISDVQAKLVNQQTAFLEYFIGDHTSFVFIITKTSADFIPLAQPKQINTSILDFRKALLDVTAFERTPKIAFKNYNQQANKVFQHLLQTPLRTLSETIKQVVIVPDGLLNTIPFEALTLSRTSETSINFSDLPYLVYDYQIAYAYSADLLLKNQTQQSLLKSNMQCLAFAPLYLDKDALVHQKQSNALRNTNTQLEGATEEIQAIAKYFDGEFDFGISATERKFKRLADQFGILHLAMHGVADLDNANFNHLKFSDVLSDSLEDNLLHHYEISNMDLRAQLVVLSACETGVGKYEKGEGVFSLARSFMYAGVPSVVMSLWKVSDVSTGQLMPHFYKNLSDGQTKDAALHQAKLQYLQTADLEYRHPFYWSAFVVLGDTQQIDTKPTTTFRWWFLGIIPFICLFTWYWRRRSV